MRMIDAEQCPCNDCVPPLGDSKGCSIFPCREFGEWYKNTAYDVEKVLEELEANTMCYDSFYDCYGECKDCSDCAINRKEAVNIIKRGGVNGY